MIDHKLTDQYQLRKDRLEAYGFKKKQELYQYQKQLSQKKLYVVFSILQEEIDVKVFDIDTNEEYLPFYVKHPVGSYATEVKEEVLLMLEDILAYCYESSQLKEALFAYGQTQYGVVPEYLFPKNPSYCTMKVKDSGKWFVMFMTVPWCYLGMDHEGSVDIINVKNTPEKIQQLLDQKTYFPAYHMNKTYWMSVVLDRHLALDQAKQLLDESYQLVSCYKKKK